ncbi:MAG: hypothetical protein ACK47D_15690, partial [Pseudanabaena sp.]
EGKDSGYFPDILVVNRANLSNEPRWKKESVLSQGASIPLAIEIVSTKLIKSLHQGFPIKNYFRKCKQR